jgi:hypothetical protein
MEYLTRYYKNLSEQLQEKVNILQAQLNEVVVTKIVNGKVVKYDPSKDPSEKAYNEGDIAGEKAAEDAAGAYPSQKSKIVKDPETGKEVGAGAGSVLSDSSRITHDAKKEEEAKKLRDMKRKSVEISSTATPEKTETMAREQDMRDFRKSEEERRNRNTEGRMHSPSYGRKADRPAEEQPSDQERADTRRGQREYQQRAQYNFVEKRRKEREQGQ